MFSRIIAESHADVILAALPTEGGYFSVPKIILFLLAFIIWAHTASWSGKDLNKLRVPKGMWVLSIFSSGVLSLVAWLFIPIFWVGLAIYVALFGTAGISYVVFRNRRVSPAETVLTPAHLQRMTSGKKTKESVVHSKDRAKIKAFNGKTPPWPKDADEHAAYQVLQDLLFDAIWRRVSDLRMDLLANQPVKIIYKVDGVDRVREPIQAEHGPMMFAHFKRISGMDPEENRKPQSGKFHAAIGAGGSAEKKVDIEAKTSGSTAGQRMILKMFAEETKFRLPDIGLTGPQLEMMQRIVAEPRGVMLISGPRGSGVTSTLYAILRSHDAFMQNIHTIEVTKTLDLENITQHVYDSQNGEVSFGKRFRSILRTEPDVCMAGDTPDTETAALAAAAGRQGKKIYLGITSSDTFTALRRYLQRVNDNALAASSLLGVSCQRLSRVLCTECRRAYKPDPKLLKKGNLPLGENRPFYRPPNADEVEVDKRGNPLICPVCQGAGYVGRTAVIELLVMDDDLRGLIAQGAPLPTLKVEARKKGMLYLQEIALHKVYDGQTSINEILRVTKEQAAAASTKAKA